MTELVTDKNLTEQDSAAATPVITPTANNLPSEEGFGSYICGNIGEYGNTVYITAYPNTLVVFNNYDRGRIIVAKVKHQGKSISPEYVVKELRDRFGLEVKIYYQSCCTEDDERQEGECLR